MKVQDTGRREFLQRAAGWGLVYAAGSYLVPSLAEGQNPPPPEPADTKWTATIVPAREPGEPLVVAGRVFAPDGQHPVAGVVVYAYNTDKDGYYSPDGKVGHPRLKGYMKTDVEGRFELYTIRPGHYPGMHIPRARAFQFVGSGLSGAMDRGVALRGRLVFDGSHEERVRGARKIRNDSAALTGQGRRLPLRNQLALAGKIKLPGTLSSIAPSKEPRRGSTFLRAEIHLRQWHVGRRGARVRVSVHSPPRRGGVSVFCVPTPRR